MEYILVVPGIGRHCATWWRHCWTRCVPSSACCYCSSYSSWSLPCWACSCLVASLTLMTQLTNHVATLIHSTSLCSQCSRYVCVCQYKIIASIMIMKKTHFEQYLQFISIKKYRNERLTNCIIFIIYIPIVNGRKKNI